MYKEVKEVECPDCFGLGETEGNKGRMVTCSTCKGKGKIYDEAKDSEKGPDRNEED